MGAILGRGVEKSMYKTPGDTMFKELKEGHSNGTADDQRESGHKKNLETRQGKAHSCRPW